MIQDNLDPDSDIETVVVCSGGGGLGLWQWTVLMGLAKHYKISMICGTSAGTLNAFGFAKGLYVQITQLYEEVFKQNAKQIFKGGLVQLKKGKLDISWLKLVPKVLFQAKKIKALMGNGPLTETLKNLHAINPSFRIPFAFNCVDLQSGSVVRFSPDDFTDEENLLKAVTASTTIPVLLPPISNVVSKKGTFQNLIDGGLRDGSPLGQMFDMMIPGKRYRIIVINCNSVDMQPDDELKNIGQIASRTAEIALNEILKGDLEKTQLINEQLKENPGKDGKIYAPISIIEYKGPIGSFNFSEESYISQYNQAIADVRNFMASV